MAFSFVNTRRWWYALSTALVVASIAAIAVFGLKLSIDFTGGSLMELRFAQEAPAPAEISSVLAEAGFGTVTAQPSGTHEALVRLAELDETRHQEALAALDAAWPGVEELRFDSIGPVVGRELRSSAFRGVVVTVVLIGLYIAWTFRRVTKPVPSWVYGVLTVVAAAHAVIIPVGLFAVLGRVLGWEVGTAFVASALTILGYSTSDAVVVFDRTRENLPKRAPDESFAEVVDKSIKQTFVRSVNTSVSTLCALFAVLVFGGDTTRPFALALFVGILVGTYSSLFIASPLLATVEARLRAKNA